MVGYPISLSSCSLVIKMPPHVHRESCGMFFGALRCRLPLLRLRLSGGGPPPCSGLTFNVCRQQENVGEDCVLLKLPPVSTYHYKCFQNIKLNKELVKVFLSRTFPAVFVGIMYQRDTIKRMVYHTLSNYIFERLVKSIPRVNDSKQQLVH